MRARAVHPRLAASNAAEGESRIEMPIDESGERLKSEPQGRRPQSLHVRVGGPRVIVPKPRIAGQSVANRIRRPIHKEEARTRDIQRIVKEGIKDRHERLYSVGALDNEEKRAVVVRPLPRRKIKQERLTSKPDVEILRDEVFEASVLGTAGRFIVWAWMLFLFQMGILWDKLRGRDNLDNRAARFLTLFQRIGGTFLKIGQQLSVRVDLLPYEYCRELSKLLDSVPPFSTEYAIKTIERTTGKPLSETFAVFDPKPIGSASIACVYQAVLKSGEKVAVKVRRPGVGHAFATDLKAVGTIISLMELLTLIRPGYLDNFVHEFRSTIFEELDFKMEAYHQTIFRRDARKRSLGKKFFTAPKVYFAYCSNEVIVEEYVAGIWMWEIIAAVENKDEAAIARMRQLNIDPKKVAEQLIFMQMWGQFVATIFHADPHPANIVVQKGGKLVFVDFGACGSMSTGKRRMMLDYMVAVSQRDVAASVRSVVGFLEPLPPIDMNSFMKEMELDMGQALLKLWSKHAPWYEKTSAAGYFKAMALTQKYQVPVSLDTVRTFRANMLYDTLAMRLHPDLDMVTVVKGFLKDTRKDAKKGAFRAIRRRMKRGLLDGGEFQILEEIGDVSGRVVQFARRYLDRPLVNFSYMVEKSFFAVVEIIRLFGVLVLMTSAAIFGVAIYRMHYDMSLELTPVLRAVFTSRIYYAFGILAAVVTLRRITLRLRDQDTSKR